MTREKRSFKTKQVSFDNKIALTFSINFITSHQKLPSPPKRPVFIYNYRKEYLNPPVYYSINV